MVVTVDVPAHECGKTILMGAGAQGKIRSIAEVRLFGLVVGWSSQSLVSYMLQAFYVLVWGVD